VEPNESDRFPDQSFEPVYRLRSDLVAYCQRRGSRDSEGIASEALSIAWDRRATLDVDDCLPWLIATARNLLHEEYRARKRSQPTDPQVLAGLDPRIEEPYEVESLNAEVDRALSSISPQDREVLLLIAWDELTPSEAARSLGISGVSFRVRLHRARSRFLKVYGASASTGGVRNEVETERAT